MQIHELKCFGTRAGEGNTALVIEGDRSDAAARQAFARKQNKNACAFIDAGNVVDYFYPHARSPLCLHATLAVAHVLLARDAGPVMLTTAMRGQSLRLTREGDSYFAGLARQPVDTPAMAAAQLARLLEAPGLVPVSAPLVASVGSPKLLVEVADRAVLYALAPDLQAIADWGKQAGVNGLFVYCRVGEAEYEGRNFNHLDPAMEDSATGVAAGALTAQLGHAIVLHQGRATGQQCLLRTRIDGQAIGVGGAVSR
ncbi:MAG: PhzF family phenazine biosynthesis protein [Pseudomonadota bacterium]